MSKDVRPFFLLSADSRPNAASETLAAWGTIPRMTRYAIAVIPGDGIGNEVVPEGVRVLEAAGSRFGIEFLWDTFPWSCEFYAKTGRMMESDGLDRMRHHDAIYLGAVGFPGVPDHVSLGGCSSRSVAGFSSMST